MKTKFDRIIEKRDRAYERWLALRAFDIQGRAAFDWLMFWEGIYRYHLKGLKI